jgi:hypothetical protein
MNRIVGFHVTEVLLAGEIDLKAEECSIIAPKSVKIPRSLADKIVYYEGRGLASRNQKIREHLESLGAYSVCMEAQTDSAGRRTWSNWTIANAAINGTKVNVNLYGSPDYFADILANLPGISYTCPGDACAPNTPEYLPYGIGHLAGLKNKITNKNAKDIIFHQKQLLEWVNSLAHLDSSAQEDFVSRIQNLPESNKGDTCIIS